MIFEGTVVYEQREPVKEPYCTATLHTVGRDLIRKIKTFNRDKLTKTDGVKDSYVSATRVIIDWALLQYINRSTNELTKLTV